MHVMFAATKIAKTPRTAWCFAWSPGVWIRTDKPRTTRELHNRVQPKFYSHRQAGHCTVGRSIWNNLPKSHLQRPECGHCWNSRSRCTSGLPVCTLSAWPTGTTLENWLTIKHRAVHFQTFEGSASSPPLVGICHPPT